MNDLTAHLKDELACHGADLIGIGDLSYIAPELRQNMPYGVAVAVAYEPEIIAGIAEMPTKEYYEAYKRLNKRLDMLVTMGAEFLQMFGYEAFAQTTSVIVENEANHSTILPHKTVSTRAGLGWIGKSALLVTKEYGSAVRISTILTNAPLKPNEPINNSKCGKCTICMDACPADAIKGNNWSVEVTRDELYDAAKCRFVARQRALNAFGIEITQCGKCIHVCPHTQKYIKAQATEHKSESDA